MTSVRLKDNVINRILGPEQPKFRIWSSAGLMLTYWCPSRCACCYVFAGPDAGREETEMSVELAIACWRGVRELAGQRGKVHITGGEPFGNYERLKRILQAACEERLGGLEKIETNAYWCTDDKLVRRRLAELKEIGLTRLQVSTDVYHQEYIPLERVERVVRIAHEVLGETGIQVRWRDFPAEPVLVANMSGSQREAAFSAALAKRRERLLGRAADELVNLFPLRSYKKNAEYNNCYKALLGARHVHIDGSGNIFCGTCIGIVAGRIDLKKRVSLTEIWRGFDYRENPIFSVLAEQGPVGLLEQAVKLGYQVRAGYADKCHLCYDIRRFLFTKGVHREILTPGVCYGENDKKTD